jgi:hypothetical protein
MSDIDRMLAIDRRNRPEQYAKADAIARIIDPGAFAEWYDGVGPDAKLVDFGVRAKYMQSAAMTKAFEILRLLKLEPEEFDWGPILTEIALPECAQEEP